jgi:hypothetical protein
MPQGETKRVLIVVRTYPTPAHKGGEVSCTAGITDKGEWIRLFPVPYRFLEPDKRFSKYQWIDVSVTKASDPRPESYKLSPESICIVSQLPAGDWKERKAVILPLRTRCLCCLKKQQDESVHSTLGLFRPSAIQRLVIRPTADQWTDKQLGHLRQQDLFAKMPTKELEKVPFKFVYEFRCDHESCVGHALGCTDWEMGESWRRWRDQYGEDQWEAKFRETYEDKMIDKYDTHFFVGTVHRHPREWIIVGLFYPPKPKVEEPDAQQRLF